MLDTFRRHGFDVFAGSEVFLLQNMRHGGVGCITATGNVNPGPIDHLYRTWQAADADHQQAEIAATRGGAAAASHDPGAEGDHRALPP